MMSDLEAAFLTSWQTLLGASSFKQGSTFPCQDHILHTYIWFWLPITDINTVIIEFSYIVGVREFYPGGTLKHLQKFKVTFLIMKSLSWS